MNWIQEYTVRKTNDQTIISGRFSHSAGKFEIEFSGDGGNADQCHVTLSDGQFDAGLGRPITFTITGSWEIREVADMFCLLGSIIDK